MTVKRTHSIEITTGGFGDTKDATDLVMAIENIPPDAKDLKLYVNHSEGDYGRMGDYTIKLEWS